MNERLSGWWCKKCREPIPDGDVIFSTDDGRRTQDGYPWHRSCAPVERRRR